MGRKRISDTSIFNNLAKKQDELDQSTYKRTKYGLDTSKDRRFADFVNIQNGFVAVPHNSNVGLIGITDEFIPPNVDMDNDEDEDEESIT